MFWYKKIVVKNPKFWCKKMQKMQFWCKKMQKCNLGVKIIVKKIGVKNIPIYLVA